MNLIPYHYLHCLEPGLFIEEHSSTSLCKFFDFQKCFIFFLLWHNQCKSLSLLGIFCRYLFENVNSSFLKILGELYMCILNMNHNAFFVLFATVILDLSCKSWLSNIIVIFLAIFHLWGKKIGGERWQHENCIKSAVPLRGRALYYTSGYRV